MNFYKAKILIFLYRSKKYGIISFFQQKNKKAISMKDNSNNLDNLLDAFDSLQSEIDETNQRLGSMEVSTQVADGAIKITATGSSRIKDLTISSELFLPEKKEELEDLLISAINKALDKAEKLYKDEMLKASKNMFVGD